MFLDIINSGGEAEEDIKNVEECLNAAWDALLNAIFEDLINSMEKGIKMCVAADRWRTMY